MTKNLSTSLKNIFRKIVDPGIDTTTSLEDSRRIRYVNFSAFAMSVLLIPVYPLFFLWGHPIAGISVFAIVFLFYFSNILNKWKFYKAARWNFIVTCNLAVFFHASAWGESVGIQNMFFPFIIFPSMFFDRKKEPLELIGAFLFSLLAWMLLFYRHYSPIFEGYEALTQGQGTVIHLMVWAIATSIILIQATYADITNVTYENQLKSSFGESTRHVILLKSVIESVPGFVSVLDKNKKYVLGNRNLIKKMSLSEQNFGGSNVGTVDTQFRNFVSKFIDDRSSTAIKNVMSLKFNHLSPPRWHIVSLERVPNSDLTVCVSIDIHNEVTLLEKNREQRAIIENSNKMIALGEMAAGIAHEINNPLAIIDLQVENIKTQFEKESYANPKVEKSLESIENTISRIVRIVKALRSFARSGTNDPFLSTPVSKILEHATELSREKFRTHGITLQIHNPNDPSLDCRESELTQVMINLLNNSYDAICDLSEKWIRVDVSDRDAYVVISVTDSGGGIAPDTADKMMQPFFTTKEVGKGTGIGLSISRGIAENHEGQLFYEPKSPRTQFILELPKHVSKTNAKVS